LLSSSLLSGSLFGAAPANSITLTDQTGTTQTNRPVSVSRVFAKGDIPNFPQPSVNGQPLASWQADVKSRWRDASQSCTIIGATNAAPIVLTCSSPHSFVPNDQVNVAGVGGNTAANGTFPVQTVTSTTITLMGTSGNGSYTSGGTVSGPAAGSVKHAIISFTQTIPASGSVVVNFSNNTNPCSAGALAACQSASQATISALLNPSWLTGSPSWGAKMLLTGPTGTVLSVDARTMLGALNIGPSQVRFWLQGPVVTQAIVEDRSPSLSQDVGFDSYHSIHPWFVITEYNGWPGVKVEFIAENTFTSNLQDQTYSIQLQTAFNGGTFSTAYTRANHMPITNLVPGSPTRISVSPIQHLVGNNDVVVIRNITGAASANGAWAVNWVSPTDFTIPVSTSGQAWAGGGTVDVYAPAASRWHKTYWAGAQPGTVKTDYNFIYLVYSQVIPNYDCAVSSCGHNGSVLTTGVTQANITAAWNDFLHSPNSTSNSGTSQGEPWGAGQYAYYFGQTGGRPELGLMETWWAQYLYSFDPTLATITFANSDTSGYVPVHFREATTTRFFDDAQTVSGFGRAVSIDGRPTINTGIADFSTAPDTVTPVGNGHKCWSNWILGCTSTNDHTAITEWSPDLAHQSQFAWAPYLFSGEYYWLEEMYFWADYVVAWSGASSANMSCWALGHCGTFGIVHEFSVQWRGVAWGIRNLGNAAFMAPDGTPESNYFNQKLMYNLALKEGQYGITTGRYRTNVTNTAYQLGYQNFGGPGVVSNPLKYPMYLDQSQAVTSSPYTDPTKVWRDRPAWENNMWLMITGHLTELGYPADKILDFTAQHVTNVVKNPAYNPYLDADYVYPIFSMTTAPCPPNLSGACHAYFTSWAPVLGGFNASFLSTYANGKFPTPPGSASATDPNFGYVAIASAGGSFLPGHDDSTLSNCSPNCGQAAWNWLLSTIPNSNATGLYSAMNSNPKWAIMPRGSTPAGSNPCDVDGNGIVTLADVSADISQVLNPSSCTTGDVNLDGQCNVIDVQIVVNAATTGVCK
jgi:hypothetical protein